MAKELQHMIQCGEQFLIYFIPNCETQLLAKTPVKREAKIKTALIIGIVWTAVSIFALLVNYRIHRRSASFYKNFSSEVTPEKNSKKRKAGLSG